jgi:hypothetical protein
MPNDQTPGTLPRREVSLDNAGETNTFALFADSYRGHRMGGSGVIIGPGLAISAKHCVEYFFSELMPEVVFTGNGSYRLGPHDPHYPTFNMRGIFFSKSHPYGLHLHIDIFQISDFSDFVLMRFVPSEKVIGLEFPKLHMAPPRVGSSIQGCGFDLIKSESPMRLPLYVSQGTVQEIHWLQRDSSLLHFPVFRTQAQFDHGMSGGPVYSEQHLLCGLICSGLAPTEEQPNAEYHSHVASLYPLLGSSIELDLPDRPAGKLYTFKNLIELGLVNMLGHEPFRVVYDPITGFATEIIKDPTPPIA